MGLTCPCCSQPCPCPPPGLLCHGCSPKPRHLPFPPAQIQLKGTDGSGLPQKQVLLLVRNQEQKKTQSFQTDSSGRASFQLDTSGWSGTVSLRVSASPVSPPRGSLSCFLQWGGALELHQRLPGGYWMDSPPDSHLRLKSAGQLRARTRAQESPTRMPF